MRYIQQLGPTGSMLHGGEVEVYHQSQSLRFIVDDASTGLFAVHLVAFYADCEHQTVPVHDGHRVSLVYNLLKTAALSAYCLITE